MNPEQEVKQQQPTEETVRAPKEVWEDLLMEVETASLDALKNIERKNAAAGVRFRKSLRRVKALCTELCKTTIATEATTKVERAGQRQTD